MILKIGSAGEAVKKLQSRLGVTPSGTFGPDTEASVKAWQKQNSLDDDGIVGDLTWQALFPGMEGSPQAVPLDGNINLESLRGTVPDVVLAQIPNTASRFNITNTLRLAHFLAQCHHESGGFKLVHENLNYSAEGLRKTFGKYFPEPTADSYARNPERIGNRVYANRMGNGDEASGDGYKYRGRGYIQLTGKDNYRRFGEFVGEDTVANPDLVATKYPLASAAFYFDTNNLWSVCDKGGTEEVVTAVTKRVNGGAIGLADRLSHFNEYNNLVA